MDGRKQDCYTKHSTDPHFGQNVKFCPLVFDGYLCWGATRAGHVAEQSCPHVQIGDSINTYSTDNATKLCDSNGNWYIDPIRNLPFTNYSQCEFKVVSNDTAILDLNMYDADAKLEEMLNRIISTVYEIVSYGYWISIVTLLICVVLLVSIKKLRCARNILHVHLFISFILRALAYLVKDATFVDGVAMKHDLVKHGDDHFITENFHWFCKAVTSIRHYFIQANYMFILMEGIYLHNLLFVNLFSEKSSVRIYYLCGWGIPLCFIPLWVVLRAIYDNHLCWTTTANKYIAWLAQKPIELSVIINFGLFISITRILCIKINSMYVQHNKIKYRRLIRSTLTLLLIYAVPYAISVVMMIMLHYHLIFYFNEETVELIWLSCDQIFTAFQGLLMGLIYCLLNSEVQSEVKQKVLGIRYYRNNAYNAKRTRATRTISNTMQFTIPIIKDDNGNGNRRNNYKTSENL